MIIFEKIIFAARQKILFALAMCVCGGIAATQCAPQNPSGEKTLSDTLRYLALGDSYTIAERLPRQDSWTTQMAEMARARGTLLGAPTIIAQTGWRTDNLLRAVAAAEADGRLAAEGYDLVSLLIGVNNQYQGGAVETFRAEFAELLRVAQKLARGQASRIVVLSIPDYSVTPFVANANRAAIADAINRFNAVKREECEKAGVAFVDITPLSREAESRPSFIISDGLHPSRLQYAEWAALALPVALKALGR
jgi:lysophospholipase L1-like esterase